MSVAEPKEPTMFVDMDGRHIMTGDVVRRPVTGNRDLHGEWIDCRVRKAPGGYVFHYLISQKGSILPEGYTAGYMADQLEGEDETDIKTLVFALRPIRVKQWKIVSE